MAQPGQAPARRFRAAGRIDGLAEGPPARRRHPSRRHFRDHRDRRRSRHRNQFPAVAAAAGLVHGECRAADLRLLGGDLWRRRPGIWRRRVDGRAEEAAADESLRLEQASVRHGGGRARRARRAAAAAMGRAEILQRVRAQRISQRHDDERAGAALRRRQGRPPGATVQVAPRRHRRRRPAPRLHLCRRRRARHDVAAGDASMSAGCSMSAPATRAAFAT